MPASARFVPCSLPWPSTPPATSSPSPARPSPCLPPEAPAATGAQRDIARPLGRTLSAFRQRQRGHPLAFTGVIEGRRSAALRGRYAPAEALHRLLGSGPSCSSAMAATPWCRATDGALEILHPSPPRLYCWCRDSARRASPAARWPRGAPGHAATPT
ncbi:hypothetical protein ACRS64_27005 [Pseudomonas aeruginosa]|uniref:hypothetical protein n=1 Tax=Pseudomonas aeruginosa TaxID=287 RepID=UPI003DA716C1